MKNTIVIAFILGCISMIACQQEIPTEGIDPTGIYTLDGIMGGDDTDSRAQIKLGKKESGVEEFFWNKNDCFALYQYKDGQLGSTTFKITDLYEESDSGKSISASFTSETPANEGRYVAVYPAHTPLVDGNALQFSFSHDLDFTDAVTPEAKNEVWKQYIKDHMFMIAEGELKKNKYNIINFRHMCTLARITLTNETGKEMHIENIQLGKPGSKQFYETSRQFVILPSYNYLGGSGCTNLYQVNTKNLVISSGETMDFYIFFLPKEFAENETFSIAIGGYRPTLSLSIKEISKKNQGATGFEAGKRYWFKVTNTLDGMVWSKNFEEFGLEGELITIDNPKFSNILQDKFGNKYITLNDEGNAVMHQSFADWVKELDLVHISGIETLAGIENFRNLERLSVRALMDLKEVDVSKNQALKYLNLSDNLNIKQLDLSQNTALDDLLLLNMPITSIDLSKNVNLETGLLLVDLPITELDVSKNIKLKSFNCRSCRISDLDITSLTQLEKLYCGGQQEDITILVYMTEKQKGLWDTEWCYRWENANVVPVVKDEGSIIIDNKGLSNVLLDMFGNKYITLNDEGNAVMYQSFADWIKELNLDVKEGIETLSGIENFKNLEKLSARDANLKAVDVSKNLALKYLDLTGNPDIKQLDLSKNILLDDLQLTNMPISSIDLSSNVNLETGLLLVNMPITQLDLSKNVKLKQLNCRSCKISELDITPLVNLEKLYCGYQQDNITIHVYMTKKQKELWDAEWSKLKEHFNNVIPIVK